MVLTQAAVRGERWPQDSLSARLQHEQRNLAFHKVGGPLQCTQEPIGGPVVTSGRITIESVHFAPIIYPAHKPFHYRFTEVRSHLTQDAAIDLRTLLGTR